MTNERIKNLTFLACGLVGGGILAMFVACDSPAVNCDTDAQCAATPACYQKHEDFIAGKAMGDCDGTPWTEPYYYVGHRCNVAGQSFYSDDRRLLQDRCVWVHRV